MKRINVVFASFLFSAGAISAQTAASLVDANYSAPAPALVAPGQVITLFFYGVKTLPDGTLRSGVARATPLPATLAGLSVSVSQPPVQPNALPVPIVSVRQEDACGGTTSISPACLLTSIRVQIPFELSIPDQAVANGALPVPAPAARLTLVEDGLNSRQFVLQPVAGNAHVVTSCDLTWDTRSDQVCNRNAFHASGRPVDEAAPARLGEEIVIYAYGLGRTSPLVATGSPSPVGALIGDSPYQRVGITFQDRIVNAPGSLPRRPDNEAANAPSAPLQFLGLAPDQVGLYQINVRIPPSLDSTVRCGGGVHSNALARVTSGYGTENIPLCVEP